MKIMSLALFFSGCNHYKSIHFADAKIHYFSDMKKKIKNIFSVTNLTMTGVKYC